jgi:hypothetical protein
MFFYLFAEIFCGGGGCFLRKVLIINELRLTTTQKHGFAGLWAATAPHNPIFNYFVYLCRRL